MAEVVFVLHPRVSADDPAIQRARGVLREHGREVRMIDRDMEGSRADWLSQPHGLEGAELAVSFGGDGTFLHAARAAIPAGVPLLGVNLGRLGFLAWVDLEYAADALGAWAGGRTTTEVRPVLRVRVGDHETIAVNEAALLKMPDINVVQVRLAVDGTPAGVLHSDGVIISTATGSTGYSASAGGPLLDPRADAVVVVALNAHNLASRALVLPQQSVVELTVNEPTRVILDGAEFLDVPADVAVDCTLDGPSMKLVRAPGSAGFYEQLRDKMNWGRPLVRESPR